MVQPKTSATWSMPWRRDSAVGLLVALKLEGDRNRVLFGPAAAFAFGAGCGLALWLLGRLRAR